MRLIIDKVSFEKQKWPSCWKNKHWPFDIKEWLEKVFAENGINVEWLYGEESRFNFVSEDDLNMALMIWGE